MNHQAFTQNEIAILELLSTPPRRGWYGSELVDTSHEPDALDRGRIHIGNVYDTLEDLVAQNFVREEADPPKGNTIQRTKHFITDSGIRALNDYKNSQKAPPRPNWGGFDPRPA